VVEHGDGWTSGGGGYERFGPARERVLEAWRAGGREGEPRTMALFYFSLGDRAAEEAEATLGAYYAFAGEYAGQIVASAATSAERVREYVAGYEAAGCDEVIAFPASADPAQVDLLAAAIA
jgi:alkanesulfonate monooxygenase SsuD/methylene tetrahydromethanopterin reductase-like flavin-dependent oxidoreductase (luciferase family)